jgi:hypothetical protein
MADLHVERAFPDRRMEVSEWAWAAVWDTTARLA